MQMSKLVNVVLVTLMFFVTSCTSSKLISISSKPDGAKVQITADQKGPNSLSVAETPTSHEFVFGTSSQNGPTTYDVMVTKDGYQPGTLTVKKDSKASIEVKLNPKSIQKAINITSEPAGAEVKITADKNGPSSLLVGKTPTTHEFMFGVISTEGPSKYDVVISMEGYIDEKLTIKKDFQDTVKVKLNPNSTRKAITITSEPAGAEVKITANQNGPNELSVGETPVTHEFVFGKVSTDGPSMYNLEFTKEFYKPAKLTIKREKLQDSIKMELVPNEMVELTRFEVLTSAEGYVIEPRKVQSWYNYVERNVASASKILSLEQNQSILGMTISPDGEKLIFSRTELIKDKKGNEYKIANLRSVPVIGGTVTKITNGQWIDANPTLDLEKISIVFNSNRIRKDRSDIFQITEKKEGGLGLIRHTSEGFNYNYSAGKGVVTFSFTPTYQGKITGPEYICSISNDDKFSTQLSEGSMPTVSPDGTTIAFIGSDKQLWKMDISGRNPVQLTNTPVNLGGKRNPVWTHDSKYIVFSADDGKEKDFTNYNIWVIHTNGHSLRQLTMNGSFDDFPVVSSDQKSIYFVSNRGFIEGIWKIPFPEF